VHLFWKEVVDISI